MPDRRFKASRFADCRSDDALRRPCEDSEVVGAGFKPALQGVTSVGARHSGAPQKMLCIFWGPALFPHLRLGDAMRRPYEDSEVVGAGFKPAPQSVASVGARHSGAPQKRCAFFGDPRLALFPHLLLRLGDAMRRPYEGSEVVGAGFKPAPTVRAPRLSMTRPVGWAKPRVPRRFRLARIEREVREIAVLYAISSR
jgi:hypothetical protein